MFHHSWIIWILAWIAHGDEEVFEIPLLINSAGSSDPCWTVEDSYWHYYNGFCYSFYTKRPTYPKLANVSFEVAESYCLTRDSNLASVHSQGEHQFLYEKIKLLHCKSFWIGYTKLRSFSGKYYWTDGTTDDFVKWVYDEPNNYLDQEMCAYMRQELLGLWNDENCGRNFGFICKRSLEEREEAVGSVIPQFDSLGCCPEPWKIIVALHESLTNANFHVWIGLSNQIGDYLWTDNSEFNYTAWAPNEPSRAKPEAPSSSRAACIVAAWTESGVKWFDHNCKERIGYICQRPQVALTSGSPSLPGYTCITQLPELEAPIAEETTQGFQLSECLSGWFEFNRSCYFVSSEKRAYEPATVDCLNRDAFLASVHSEDENRFILSKLQKYRLEDSTGYWIGLTNLKFPYGSFVWVDGTPVDYENSRFTSRNGSEVCALYYGHEASWSFGNCHHERKYLCKQKLKPDPLHAPVRCPPGWYTYVQNKCYQLRGGELISEKTDYLSATSQCRSLGPGVDLISIHNTDEQDVITAALLYSNSNAWIGLSVSLSSRFIWNDDSVVNFFNSSDSVPTAKEMMANKVWTSCLAVQLVRDPIDNHQTGWWILKSCDDLAAYICQMDIRQDRYDDPTSSL